MKKIIPLSDTTLACTVCGESSATLWRVGVDHLLGGMHRYRAVRCIRCGTRRLDPRPDTETMARYYRPETYARAEEAGSEVGKRLDAYTARLAARFDAPPRSGASPAKALDVGCGDGRFLTALRKKGWEIEGTETDPDAAALARNRTRSTVYETPLPPKIPGNIYDLVSLLHVLEHVTDPRETLDGVRGYLRPGGELLLVLPNADSLEADLFGASWYHLDLPRHFWAFSPATLVRLVETCGFEIREIRYTPFLFAPQSLLRSFGAANGAIPGRHVTGTGRSGSGGGGAWQTRVFDVLLKSSDRLGRMLPGEIIELTATVPGGRA